MLLKNFSLFSNKTSVSGPVEWIIAGLGNPGKKYENTRHNVGFDALDGIAKELNVRIERVKFRALCGDALIDNRRVLLLKPTTLMNLSGQAIQEAAAFYKIPPERILVFCDDINLAPGKLRIRSKGSAGGHNGLKDIIARLGSENFPRVRIGVGQKPHPDYDLADWVLGKFAPADRILLDRQLANALAISRYIVAGDTAGAMNQFNRNGV